DAGWRQRILRSLPLSNDSLWIEIGAGHGEITRDLAHAVKRLIAIELDPPLVKSLERLSDSTPNLDVVAGNILEVDLATLAGNEKFRVYGNLPYYITSPIIHHLFQFSAQLVSVHIVIQLEVAARLAAQPGRRDYGYLSVFTQLYSRPEIVFKIPPGAFRPAPKVASALVRLDIHPTAQRSAIRNVPGFLRFVQQCFSQKRKTLLNNLRAAGMSEHAKEAMDSAEIPAGARAEELSLTQFTNLFGKFAE
ncbi:MAG: ribosomal RNA small subunit methyltransferase A, partial [Acidobacteria bacterium]|nr:ribosomal RNA small subunit methyltransferase A [Acidobacteriota bacterium]